MTNCPKCGSWRMSGPRYRRSYGYFGECLEYRCLNCGYASTRPTNDADERALPQDPWSYSMTRYGAQ